MPRYDFLSGKPHPVTIAAREKLKEQGESLSETERANRVAAIERAQAAAVRIERMEARARATEEQRKASEHMRAEQRKPFAALRMAQQRSMERSKRAEAR